MYGLFSILSAVSLVVAHPSLLHERGTEGDELSHLAARIETEARKINARHLTERGFQASKQHVSISGDHAFVAPGPNDLRGPCPGLNAMANHGYIPHNGIATITEVVNGANEVYGMGVDLGTFLSIYAAVFDGDLTKWSIGGPPYEGLSKGIGLFGAPKGISNSHNKFETDVSPTRGDLYEYNDAVNVQLSQFEQLYKQPLGKNGYDIETLTKFRAIRLQQSIHNNPYFFNAPFTTVAVQPAAYAFIYRFFANKSAEYTEGYLNGDVLKSFFSITGEPGNFKYTPGQEKIPKNWYKRAVGDEYGLAGLVGDITAAAKAYPEFLSLGGNTGKVNNFTNLDLGKLTKGVFNASTLLEGNNLGCFAFQFTRPLTALTPNYLTGIFSAVTESLIRLTNSLGTLFDELSCPQLAGIDTTLLEKFPGSGGAY